MVTNISATYLFRLSPPIIFVGGTPVRVGDVQTERTDRQTRCNASVEQTRHTDQS